MTPRTKQCRRCRLTKTAEMFYRTMWGTLQSYCKDCHRLFVRESSRRHYAKRAEKDKARKRKRYWTESGYKERKSAASTAYKRRIREARHEDAA